MQGELTLVREPVEKVHRISHAVATVIACHHRRDVDLDYEFLFVFRYSNRRNVSVYITECAEHEKCFQAAIYVYDPSMTTNYSEDRWTGFGPTTVNKFSVGELVDVLGLASLHGGLAAVEMKLHFYEQHAAKVPHTIMRIAGVVDMYCR